MATKRELKREVAQVWNNQAAGKSLAAVLAIPDRPRFMLTLEHYFCPPGSIAGWTWSNVRTKLTPEAQMVLILNAFDRSVFGSGMAAFLIDNREVFETAAAICKTIGAARAAEYIENVAACFPAGKIPATAEECADVIFQDDSETESCLRQLDARYRNARDEVIDCLRRYIAANQARFEKASIQQ